MGQNPNYGESCALAPAPVPVSARKSRTTRAPAGGALASGMFRGKPCRCGGYPRGTDSGFFSEISRLSILNGGEDGSGIQRSLAPKCLQYMKIKDPRTVIRINRDWYRNLRSAAALAEALLA